MSEALDLSPNRPSAQNVRSKKTRKTEKKKSAGSFSAVPLPPCKVCGGTSTGYHFGAITCEACKAFFRRALLHKHEYECLRGDNCTIIDKKLGNCSACRLKKCYAVGMSKGGIKKGRYSIAVRTKAIIEAKANKEMDRRRAVQAWSRSESSEDNSSSSSSPSGFSVSPSPGEKRLSFSGYNEDSVTITIKADKSSSPYFNRNIELELLIDAITGYQEAIYPDLKTLHQSTLADLQQKSFSEYTVKQKAFEELYGKANTVSAEEFKQIFAETGIDLDDRVAYFNRKGNLMEETIAQYVNFGKIVPGFKNLNPKDVSRLLKAAHLEFWLFGNFMNINNELGVAVFTNGRHYGYKDQIQKFFSKEWVDASFKMAESIKALNLTMEEIALIRVIILTSTDRCEVTERAYIQSLQEKFVECLVYQLHKTRNNPSKFLCQIFDRLMAVRELTEMNFKENRNFLKKWEFLVGEFPLWKEMLSFDEY